MALDGRDAIIAIGMNGESLPREHGFPARMVVPGLYGFVSACKWITRITLTTYDAEQVDREIAAERKREAALGLDFRRPGSPAQAARGSAAPGAAEGQRQDQQDSDDQDDDGEDREPRPTEEG